MSRDVWYTLIGSALGSILEEIAEEIWPIPEQEWTGEIAGAIAGLFTSQLTKDEVKNSLEQFVRYVHRQINLSKSKELTEEELKLFSEHFKKIPKKQKREIINSYKSMAPYEYELIREIIGQAIKEV